MDSTFHHQPTAGGPPFSPERETYSMLLFVQLLHSCLLHRGKSATCYRYSQALTYSNLLSTIFDGPPLSPERETYGMLLFIQLLHSCLLRRGKGATCYRYSQALTYSILLSTIFDGPPSLSREGNVLHASLRTAFAFLSFKQRK